MSHALVICAKRFNGHELFTLLGVLQLRGHTFEVVSQDTLIRDELTMRPNTLKRTVWATAPSEVVQFDAIIVVSGNMKDTEAYWTDPHIASLLQVFHHANKPIGAICCSVPTLSPVIKGIRVSYFPLIRSKQRLLNGGAILQNVSITVDGKFATAENQMMSQMWAEEICNLLEDKPPQHTFQDSGFKPKGHERMMPPDVRASIDEARGFKMVIRKPPKEFS